MSRLVVRADAGPGIGLGHVMRCIALAQAWSESGGDVVFATAGAPPPVAERLRAEGFGLVGVPARHPDPRDLGAVEPLLPPPTSWIAVDGYHFDDAYREQLRRTGARVLSIGDGGAPIRAADAVLNQNGGAEYDVPLPLVGPGYALIRNEFRGLRRGDDGLRRPVRNLLVTFGGGDDANHGGRIVADLAGRVPDDVHVLVLVGTLNPHRTELERIANAAPFRVDLLDGADVAAAFEQADLVVTAAGSTCWELCYIGVPMVAVVVADNQQAVAAALAAHGAAEVAGVETAADAAAALAHDDVLCASLAAAAQTLVDGQGAARVVAALREESA